MIYYGRVLGELNRKKGEVPDSGGIAVNLYGVPRATADLDLLLQPGARNLEKFLGAMGRMAK
ncbi:MAG: hypothetical protein QW435_03530 [Candidatus Hadarchaeales archaeon]